VKRIFDLLPRRQSGHQRRAKSPRTDRRGLESYPAEASDGAREAPFQHIESDVEARAVEIASAMPDEPAATEEPAPGERVGQRRGTVAGTAFANYVKYGLSILTGPVTARALGPVGRGTVALVSIYDSLTTTLFSVGVPSAAGYYAMKKRYSREALMGSVFRMSLLLLPIVALAAFGVVVGPLAKFGTPVRVSAVVLVFLSPVSAVGLTGRAFLLADGDLKFLRADDLLPILVNAAIVLPFGLLGMLNVPLAVVAIILGNALAVLWAFFKAGVRPRGRAPMKPLLSFGSRSLLGALANFGNNTLDQAIVAPILGVKALGYYAVAASVGILPLGLAQAFGYRSFGSVGAGHGTAASSEAEAALRMTLLSTATLSVLLMAISPVAIPLAYGGAFRHAVPSTVILLAGAIGFGMAVTANQCSQALGVPQYTTIGAVVGLIITVPGLAVAVPLLGIIGAAIVSAVAYTVRAGLTLILLRRVGVQHILPRWRDVRRLAATLRRILREARRGAGRGRR
jgi:O-antigen/teichoic acid export membrane protein